MAQPYGTYPQLNMLGFDANDLHYMGFNIVAVKAGLVYWSK